MVPAHNRFAVFDAMVLVAALISMGPVAITAVPRVGAWPPGPNT
jgi:hypothetical protein